MTNGCKEEVAMSFRIKALLSMALIAWMGLCAPFSTIFAQEMIKIGLNYPKTGLYSVQGLDQWRAANLAAQEINLSGGILGKRILFVERDTVSDPAKAAKNAVELIEKDKVKMIFGGSSSAVAVAVSQVCQEKGELFMATLTASNTVTGEQAHRHTFRLSFNAWMGAKAMSSFLKKRFAGKRYFYIVADYTWGWSSEASIRRFTDTEDTTVHIRVRTPLGADRKRFQRVISLAKLAKPDVLVLILFGKDLATTIRLATLTGLKKRSQIVVPLLELGLAEGAGPKVMEDVIGTSDWNWKVPYKYNHMRGKAFVEKFVEQYNRYPDWAASLAYTNLYEYKYAVERAGTTDAPAVIRALEGHRFTLLKDEQYWRAFDHQAVQSVYMIKCNPKEVVMKDRFHLDYFEILEKFSGEAVVQTRKQWEARRKAAGKPPFLEELPVD